MDTSEQRVQSLIDDLMSSEEEVRVGAERELVGMGADAVRPLLVRLRRCDLASYRAILGDSALTLACTAVIFVSGCLALRQFQVALVGSLCVVGSLVSLFALRAALGGGTSATPTVTVVARIVQVLAQCDDMRAIPEFLDVLQSGSAGDVRAMPVAYASLARLLPRLTRQDAGLLSGPQLLNLYGALGMEPVMGWGFRPAVLHAIAEVGDARAVRHVEPIADYAGDDPRVIGLRYHARKCLAELKERLDRERTGATLLRPAEIPHNDVLLRPAGPGESDKEQLLRPVQPE